MATGPVMIDISSELVSERLMLRVPRFGDGVLVNAAVVESVVELGPWMPWATPTPKPDDTELWCRQSAAKFLTREMIHFSLWADGGKTCAGGCGMHRIDWNVPMGELGYWLRTSFCGQGRMTEAVNA